MPSADDVTDNLAQLGALLQRNKNPPQVVSVGTFIAGRAGCEVEERETTLRHLVQSALRQEGLSAEQREKTLQFTIVAERTAIALVKFPHLVECKVGQHQARTHIKRRLVYIGDEQVRLAGVGNGEGEILPGSGRIERTLVVPGAKQSKDFAAKVASTKTIHFVHSPDQMTVDLAENLASKKALEIHACPAARIPALLWGDIQIEMFRNGLRQTKEQTVRRLQVRRIELLEIRKHHSGSGFACLLQPARHEGSLAHLTGAFQQDDTVIASHRGIELLVGGTDDVEFGIERQRSTNRFQVRLAVKRLLRSLESLGQVGDNPLIIRGILPESVVEPIESGMQGVRKLRLILHSYRKKARLAVLTLGK